jgi:hypothetical protein
MCTTAFGCSVPALGDSYLQQPVRPDVLVGGAADMGRIANPLNPNSHWFIEIPPFLKRKRALCVFVCI